MHNNYHGPVFDLDILLIAKLRTFTNIAVKDNTITKISHRRDLHAKNICAIIRYAKYIEKSNS